MKSAPDDWPMQVIDCYEIPGSPEADQRFAVVGSGDSSHDDYVMYIHNHSHGHFDTFGSTAPITYRHASRVLDFLDSHRLEINVPRIAQGSRWSLALFSLQQELSTPWSPTDPVILSCPAKPLQLHHSMKASVWSINHRSMQPLQFLH